MHLSMKSYMHAPVMGTVHLLNKACPHATTTTTTAMTTPMTALPVNPDDSPAKRKNKTSSQFTYFAKAKEQANVERVSAQAIA